MTSNTLNQAAALATLATMLATQALPAYANKTPENGDGPVVTLTMHDGLDRGPIIDSNETGTLPSLGCQGPLYSGEVNEVALEEWAFQHPYVAWTNEPWGPGFYQVNPYLLDTAYFFRETGKYSFTLAAGDVSGIARLQVRIREWTVASDIAGMPYEPGSDDLVFDFSPHNAVQSGQGVTTGDWGNFYSYNEEWLTLERTKIRLQDTLNFSVNSLGRDATVFVYATDGAGNETMGKVVLAPDSLCVDR